MTRDDEYKYSRLVAFAHGWDEESTCDLGIMLWCLVRYYMERVGTDHKKENENAA